MRTQTPPTAVPSAGSAQPIRVLLADDSPDNRFLIRAYLKDPIYQLDEAKNGGVAVEMVKTQRYDVVLMDIQMPVMDGLTAPPLIREWEHAMTKRHMPIVALTASALEEDVRRTLEAGADRHVSKPVRKATLVATIDSVVLGKGRRAQAPAPLAVVRA
jgi:CheY-like chemotaxis protein